MCTHITQYTCIKQNTYHTCMYTKHRHICTAHICASSTRVCNCMFKYVHMFVCGNIHVCLCVSMCVCVQVAATPCCAQGLLPAFVTPQGNLGVLWDCGWTHIPCMQSQCLLPPQHLSVFRWLHDWVSPYQLYSWFSLCPVTSCAHSFYFLCPATEKIGWKTCSTLMKCNGSISY